MAWWKKLLIWLGGAAAFCVLIFLLFHYLSSNAEYAQMSLGRYNLTSITQTDADGNQTTIQEFENGEFYIVVEEDFMLVSSSGEYGILPSDGGYQYFLHGIELIVLTPQDGGTLAYTGLYQDNTISIQITKDEITTCYNYILDKSSE